MEIMMECDVDRHASLTGTKKSHPFITTYLEVTSLQPFSNSILQIDVAATQPKVLLTRDKS